MYQLCPTDSARPCMASSSSPAAGVLQFRSCPCALPVVALLFESLLSGIYPLATAALTWAAVAAPQAPDCPSSTASSFPATTRLSLGPRRLRSTRAAAKSARSAVGGASRTGRFRRGCRARRRCCRSRPAGAALRCALLRSLSWNTLSVVLLRPPASSSSFPLSHHYRVWPGLSTGLSSVVLPQIMSRTQTLE
jgi:hypothetical protein